MEKRKFRRGRAYCSFEVGVVLFVRSWGGGISLRWMRRESF